MSAWPPTDNKGRLDRRTADVRILTGFARSIDSLVDLASVQAEAKTAAIRAMKANDPETTRQLLLIVVSAIDQAQEIRADAWDAVCALDQAFRAIVTLSDVENRHEPLENRSSGHGGSAAPARREHCTAGEAYPDRGAS